MFVTWSAPAKKIGSYSRGEAMVFVAALAAVVFMELGRRWVLPPPLFFIGAFVWSSLCIVAFARRWQSGFMLLVTLPAGLLLAFAVQVACRHYLGLPLLS
jgi:hypothetical protein